jgi:hypothetical protein
MSGEVFRVLLVGDCVRRHGNPRVGRIQQVMVGDWIRFRYEGSTQNQYANAHQLVFVAEAGATTCEAPPWDNAARPDATPVSLPLESLAAGTIQRATLPVAISGATGGRSVLSAATHLSTTSSVDEAEEQGFSRLREKEHAKSPNQESTV